jgi:hypothetical protein
VENGGMLLLNDSLAGYKIIRIKKKTWQTSQQIEEKKDTKNHVKQWTTLCFIT